MKIFTYQYHCLCCEKPIALKNSFCGECREMIPEDIDPMPAEILAKEIQRNKDAKSLFYPTFRYGDLEFDTLHNMFHVKNKHIWRKVTDIENYSFDTGKIHFRAGSKYMNVYFIYNIRKQQKVQKYLTQMYLCRYYQVDNVIHVEPPDVLLQMKQQFGQMQENEIEKIASAINAFHSQSETAPHEVTESLHQNRKKPSA